MSGAASRAGRALALLAPLALLLALVGSDPAGAAPGEGAAPPADTVVVTMTNTLVFEPAKVRIRPGQTVLWRNTSQIAHTVTGDPEQAQKEESVALPEGAEPFDSGVMEPGAEFAHTFQVLGEHTYFCLPHELAGMVGRVIVEKASGST